MTVSPMPQFSQAITRKTRGTKLAFSVCMPTTRKASPRKNTPRKSSPRKPAAGKTHSSDKPARPRRGIWSGSISFGLVDIPVKLVPAEQTSELSFHQYDKRDLAPIGYQLVNKSTGKEVSRADVVKGHALPNGDVVVLDAKDFANANVEATQTINILEMVRAEEIDPIYFEKPYFLVPDKKGARAYSVLRDALISKEYVAIAMVVMHTRQHLCAVLAREEGLILEILRFGHELRGFDEMEIGNAGPAINPKERQLAEQLIEGMVGDWDPSKYRDSYRDDLMAAIERKVKTGSSAAPAEVKETASKAGPSDLLTLLKQSLESKDSAPAKTKKKSAA